MPIRPRQHELEDESRAKFQLILPKSWVFRDKPKDYGIDGEIELFDDTGHPTGLVFWVQLKGTDSELESEILNVDLALDTLKYYKKLTVPVLLARYSSAQNSFYVKWVNNVDFYHAKDEAKSLRIKFTGADVWVQESSKKIKSRLTYLKILKSGAFNFPLPTSISINRETIKGFSRERLIVTLTKKIKQYPKIFDLTKEKDPFVQIDITEKELSICICDYCGTYFHNLEHIPVDGFIDNIIHDIVFGLSMNFVQLGQYDNCARVIFENSLDTELGNEKDFLNALLPALLRSSYFEKVLELVSNLLDETSEEHIKTELIAMINLIQEPSANDQRDKLIEKFNLARLERKLKVGNRQQIGIGHYNLGNFYRSRKNYQKAIHHYMLAKRFAPIYLNQHYFFKEIAGLFFLLNKFKPAARFYSKAIELNDSRITRALYADSLLFAGEYEKSKQEFEYYLHQNENPSEEFILKKYLIERLLLAYGITSQVRKEAIKIADVTGVAEAQIEDRLNQALQNDLLCDLAWFNFGAHFLQKKDWSKATFCFTMAAIILPKDIQAWVNAVLCSFNSKVDSPFLLITRVAYSLNQESFLESLYTGLEANSKKVDIKPIIEMIKEILPEPSETEKSKIRILNEQGKFEAVELRDPPKQ